MLPIPAMLRWSSSASPIGRVRIVGAQPCEESARRVKRRAPARRARAPPGAGRTGCGPRSATPAAARRTAPPRCRRRATPAMRATLRSPPPAALFVHAPDATHAQMRVDHEVALEAQEQVLAVRVDACDGPPRQALRPAVLPVARVWRSNLIGHLRPSRIGRIRFAAQGRSCRPQAPPPQTGTLRTEPSAYGDPPGTRARPRNGNSEDTIADSPSIFSSASRLIAPWWTCSTSAVSAGSRAGGVFGADESVCSARPARFEVQDRLAAGEHDVGARLARRRASGALRPAQGAP